MTAKGTIRRLQTIRALMGIDDFEAKALIVGLIADLGAGLTDCPPPSAAHVLNFGKYQGKTLAEVYESDRQYLEWVAGSVNFAPVAGPVKQYLRYRNSENAAANRATGATRRDRQRERAQARIATRPIGPRRDLDRFTVPHGHRPDSSLAAPWEG